MLHQCMSVSDTPTCPSQKPSTPLQGTPQYNRAFRDQGSTELDVGCIECKDEVDTPCGRLSDTHLASRRASEAVERRHQAASWLQQMIGSLNLSSEPSEEELQLCLQNGIVLCTLINKVNPGAVPKIVENPVLSTPLEGMPLTAFQYFENVRNFLKALEELKLPSFDASDLEKLASSAKVVDCILSIKAYYEWQQAGGQGTWKLGGGPVKTPSTMKMSITRPRLACSWLGSGRSSSNAVKPTGQNLRGWNLESLRNMSEEYDNLVGAHGKVDSVAFMEALENAWANFDSNVEWVQHVCEKFVETFMSRSKNSEESSALGIPDTNMPCEALLKLVLAVLHDKNPEEVAILVECMLKKVIEEFGKRALCHDRQLPQPHDKLQAPAQHANGCKGSDQHYVHQLEIQGTKLQEVKHALKCTRQQFEDFKSGWAKEMEIVGVKLNGLSQTAAEYHKVVAENRELYNQVQDLKGNIRVYCRVRPFLPGQDCSHSTVDFVGDKGSIMIVNPLKPLKEQCKAFTFNKAFGPSASQEEIFLDTQPLIRSVLDGYNVCIFAYGQTGSGKTYTMSGPNNPSSKDWGVNIRALHDLFQISHSRQDLISYEVGVQMMEIYNEQVRDLLCAESSSKKLEIRNKSQQNGLNVPDASLLPVKSIDDVLNLMALGQKNRAVGSTAMNERSSRSHSVLTVHVKGIDIASRDVLRGCLHLVDLAGSERVDKSEVTGDRLREAQHINKSLSALGDVIAALAQKSPHVPYRNSKLTQLLQDSLGGQAKTLMFVHISPDEGSYGETISTLKFAERVASVELGAAQSNKESGEVKNLKDQIASLKDALSKKEEEIKSYQKDFRTKAQESLQERPRVKAGVSPVHLGMVTGHASQRVPLEEVRNTEIHHSPAVAQKWLIGMGFPSTNRAHQESPLRCSVAQSPDVSNGCEEDTLKRRSHPATSPEGHSTLINPETAANASKKNKIRRSSHDEPGHYTDMSTPSNEGAITPISLQSHAYYHIEEPDDGYVEANTRRRFNVEHGSQVRNSHSLLVARNTKSLLGRDPQSMDPCQELTASDDSCSSSTRDDDRLVERDEEVRSEAESRRNASMFRFGKRKDSDKRFAGQHKAGHSAKRLSTSSMMLGSNAVGASNGWQLAPDTCGTDPKRKGGRSMMLQPKPLQHAGKKPA